MNGMIQEEIWKDVCGYEGIYKVSNIGNVMSLKRKRVPENKIIKKTFDGIYFSVNLSSGGINTKHRIHRLVALAFIGNPMDLAQIHHKKNDTRNNSVENLEWCSQEYNLNERNNSNGYTKTNIYQMWKLKNNAGGVDL